MGKKYFRDWQNFVDSAGELLNENMRKSRVTLKYRNKLPSYGKLYVTDDNKPLVLPDYNIVGKDPDKVLKEQWF